MNVEVIWENFLNNIKNEVNDMTYITWFQDLSLYEYKDGVCKIIVPLNMHKRHLNTKYYDLIISNLNELFNDNISVEFYTQEEIDELTKENDELTHENNINIDNNNISNKNINNDFFYSNNLMSRYTFENFIVGDTNKFAHHAALQIAESPGTLYNPLFIYGNSGLGKTHLMHAIGNHIAKNSNLRVLYVSSDEFITEFIGINKKDENGQNYDRVDYFKNKYRNVDVLMVDDIQFFQSTPKSQDEFFKIFEVLYRNNKQIVLASDRSPKDLKNIEDRLKTRFCWGLMVDISPPDFDLRVAILKKKIIGENININIPDDVIEYIASNMGNDIRSLEGSINRLLAYATYAANTTEINLDIAVEALKDDINKGYSEKNSINKIQRIVAEHFQISVDDMKSKKRSAKLAIPRQIAMYLCRVLTDESLEVIGIDFGGKDHTTVMYAVEKVEKELLENKELAKTIDKIKNELE